ncbi:MAG TPA: DUF5686 family protein [Bacteroidales bacterium]|nr:DUF5686 family protein [Bacteroidales bacterium]HPT01942.1 DUF5686 family protein [Bacteroidales bacterium]
MKMKYLGECLPSRLQLSFLLTFAMSGLLLHAQEVTKITGTVTDASTGQPMPFVNVYFKGSTVGATTGFDGKYSLESRKIADSLIASFVGYHTFSSAVKPNQYQVIDIKLNPVNLDLPEVVIVPGVNPAEILLKKIIDHKPENDPARVDEYRCETYTKMQFDVNNLSSKFQDRRVMKPFRFVFENLDTSVVNGKAYLPVMLSESVSDVYYRYSPRSRKEIIKASKISGIENASMSQFVGSLAQDVNIYENFITLFQKNFPSPINSTGLLYYRYYLIDSATIDGHWCYNIMFKPRFKQATAFTGNLWANDTSFAVKKLEMRLVDDANVNFINDLVISQDFDKMGGKHWMLSKERMVADFNVFEDAKKTMGFYGARTAVFRNFSFDAPPDQKIYSIPNDIIVLKDAAVQSKNFWEESRPEELTHREASVYLLADTLLKMPVFNTYFDVIKMVMTGYYVKGKFEWGPYASMLSSNAIEGVRLRVGGRTSNDFSKRLMLEGYMAYGIHDERLKYKGGFVYMLQKAPDRVISGSYKYDTEQLGMGEDALREDFFLSSVFRRNPQDKLSLVKEIKGSYKHEWFTGFSNTLTFSNRNLYNIGNTGFSLYDPQGGSYEPHFSLITSELQFDLHYGYREKVLAGEFERVVVSSPYPVLDLNYTYGVKGLFNGDYEYHKAQLRVTQWFNFLSAGWSKYSVEAGKIWGKLPYPLLRVHSGNETFWFDEYSYNLMNYYEFISDEYVNAMYSHHFEGFFLNHIPVIRKLKWREVAQARIAFGHTSDKNLQYNSFPTGTYALGKPYVEVGAGIENIFRFIRIDGIWRLTYNDHPDTNRFGVMVSMNFIF